jgi:glutamyl-tRNA reductase
MADLILFGVSFRTAPVAVRKALSFDASEIGDLLRRARTDLPDVEALVLSTCNRTEFYLAAEDVGAWHALLKRVRPAAPATPDDCHFYERRGADAFRHLARVACGLESAILGDTQVLSQLRAGVTLAQEHGILGRELSQATGTALRVGRAARAQTAIAAGSAGIGSAVSATIMGRPDSKRVAVLGAGEAARSVARHLSKRGIVELTFCNRTAERAGALAAEHAGIARPWTELETVLRAVDAAVVATSAPAPVLEASALAWIGDWREAAGRKPLILIDAGFPPQVASGPVRGVRRIPLDALRQGEDEALAARRAAVPAVEAMVDEAVARWLRRRAEFRLSGSLRRLHEQADSLTQELTGELTVLGLSASDAEQMVRRPMRRLLHNFASELRLLDAGKTT